MNRTALALVSLVALAGCPGNKGGPAPMNKINSGGKRDGDEAGQGADRDHGERGACHWRTLSRPAASGATASNRVMSTTNSPLSRAISVSSKW